MNFSLLNNEFCNAKFLTMFLIFMRLILSIEEVEEKKKVFKPTIIPYPLQTKIIPKIQIFVLFLYLVNFSYTL